MVSSKRIKEFAEKEDKKLSKKAIGRINKYLEKKVLEIIKSAKKNADFYGRKIIKEEDLVLDEE